MKAYNKLSELPIYESVGLELLQLSEGPSWWSCQAEQIIQSDDPTRTLTDLVDNIIGQWHPMIENRNVESMTPRCVKECYAKYLADADYVFEDGYGHYHFLWNWQLPRFIEAHTIDEEIIEHYNETSDNGEKVFKVGNDIFWSEDIEDEAEAERFAIGYQFGINPNTLDYDEGFDHWTNGEKDFNVSEEDRFKGSTEVQFGDYCLYVTDVINYRVETIDRNCLNQIMDKILSNYKVADGELKDLPVEITMFDSFRNWQDYKENEHDVRVDDGEIPADSEIHNSIFEYYDYLMESDEGLDEFMDELTEKIDAVVYTEYDNIYIYKHK